MNTPPKRQRSQKRNTGVIMGQRTQDDLASKARSTESSAFAL